MSAAAVARTLPEERRADATPKTPSRKTRTHALRRIREAVGLADAITQYRWMIDEIHANCRHKYAEPERVLVPVDHSRYPDYAKSRTPHVVYVRHRCVNDNCGYVMEYPVVDFCSKCGFRTVQGNGRPPGWTRETQDPWSPIMPEAYVCSNPSCGHEVIVLNARYEPYSLHAQHAEQFE